MRLLGIGDNVLDHYVDTGVKYPGGNAVNVAVFAARQGASHCAYIGIVGSDAEGDHLLESLAAEGLDLSLVRRAVGPNGIAMVSIADDGDRVFVGSNKGGVQHALRLRLTESDMTCAEQNDVAHSSVYSSMEQYLPQLARATMVSFDFSHRRDAAYLAETCPSVAHAFFSGADLDSAELNGLCDSALGYGCETVVVTRGSAGAWVATPTESFAMPAEKSSVVDTLGAGDAFIAGFLVSLYEQQAGAREAARRGADAAAQACMENGAFGRGLQHEGAL